MFCGILVFAGSRFYCRYGCDTQFYCALCSSLWTGHHSRRCHCGDRKHPPYLVTMARYSTVKAAKRRRVSVHTAYWPVLLPPSHHFSLCCSEGHHRWNLWLPAYHAHLHFVCTCWLWRFIINPGDLPLVSMKPEGREYEPLQSEIFKNGGFMLFFVLGIFSHFFGAPGFGNFSSYFIPFWE